MEKTNKQHKGKDGSMNSDEVYDRLKEIAKASGHAKLPLLNHEDLKWYLKAAYDPFTMYNHTKVPIGSGNKMFEVSTINLLEALANRDITGSTAENEIHKEVSQMTEKSALLFGMILNKDLRIGASIKTINKVFPGLIPSYEVMLAKLFDPKKIAFPCYGGPKIDGIRATYINTKKKFYTRSGHEIIGVSHLVDQLALSNAGHDLDGELFIPGMSFQQSSGLIRNDSPTPNAAFAMFEVPTLKDPFVKRLEYITEIAQNTQNILALKHYKLNDLEHAYKFYAWCRKKGYEGAVVRPLDYEYVQTRSWSWMKMKNIMDFDLKVIDLYEGKGKYKNHLGGVYVEYNGKQAVGGGFSDHERKIFWDNPHLIVGKTLHVVVTEFTNDSNFRHARKGPQGIRSDK